MRQHKIYLVGQISSNPDSYQWRLNLQWHLKEYDERVQSSISLIDPCKNSMNLGLIKEAKHDESKFNDNAFNHLSMSILAPLDAGYVKESTVCIANLNHFTPERPIIGSYFELAWYYYNFPHKPVIGVLNGNPQEFYHTKHPFVQAAVHVWVTNEKQALDLIVKQCFC